MPGSGERVTNSTGDAADKALPYTRTGLMHGPALPGATVQPLAGAGPCKPPGCHGALLCCADAYTRGLAVNAAAKRQKCGTQVWPCTVITAQGCCQGKARGDRWRKLAFNADGQTWGVDRELEVRWGRRARWRGVRYFWRWWWGPLSGALSFYSRGTFSAHTSLMPQLWSQSVLSTGMKSPHMVLFFALSLFDPCIKAWQPLHWLPVPVEPLAPELGM